MDVRSDHHPRVRTQSFRILRAALAWVIAVGSLTGCSLANSVLKSGPAPDSGFLSEPERMAEHRERFPFNRVWVEDGFRVGDHHSVVVAPVNTDHALARSTWARINVREVSVEDDLAGIAAEFQQTIIDAFRNNRDNHFAIVDPPGDDDSLVLELAITELVPSKAFLATIGLAAWAAPVAVGVPVGTAAAFAQSGWMAIEGRVRIGEGGPVVVMFADREQSKMRIVDLQAITWYGHARESMHDWATQLVALANTPHEFKVEDSSGFTLLPW
jgi:hypothetical protein